MAPSPVNRTSAPMEFNKFIAGLITDSNPLTSVPNSSIDETNFVLNIDGSRRRRLGIDYEDSYVIQTTTISGISGQDVATTSFKWKNAGGIPNQSLSVIQIGNEIKIYDITKSPASANLIYTYKFVSADPTQNFAYAVVDGILVVASGDKNPSIFTFTLPSTVTKTSTTLYVRDFFGVEDIYNGQDLYDGNNVQNRPMALSGAHLYNLRNQTWGVPRLPRADGAWGASTTTVVDPIYAFASQSAGSLPSNSDNVNEALFPDPASTNNPTADRFWPIALKANPLGTEKAPSGFFIIDALARGTSRRTVSIENDARYLGSFSYGTGVFPSDTTPGGPSVLAEFAGRAFFGGFSGNVVDGDKLSPRMSSYILFSQIVSSINDIGRCYQKGDPTTKASPDLVDTDGGYLRLNGAYGIKAMLNIGAALVVFASNGVWRIYGNNNSGFTATGFIVEKVSDHGVSSSDSVVLVDGTVMFWGSDAIYHLHPDQFGSFVVENISSGRIQTLFDDIPFDDKVSVRGSYDTFDRKVRWLYYNRTTNDTPVKELVLDIALKAFYVNTIGQSDTGLPRVVGYFIDEPYTTQFSIENVTVSGGIVTVGGVNVTVNFDTKLVPVTREVGYITITQLDPVIKYTFASYKDNTFRDWKLFDGVGVDAAAYLITSYSPNGDQSDFQRNKQVPYITTHMNRTETGFVSDGSGGFLPENPSGCIAQARWEWSDTSNANRWSAPFQIYRYLKPYTPSGLSDKYDTGYSTIVTRNRVRGTGKVLSLKFSTEPDKDCHLYGWSLIMSMDGNV